MAGHQEGLISTTQLHAVGFTPTMIAGAVRRGQLHRIHRGVYQLGHASSPSLLVAAVLTVPGRCALTGLSVLRALGVLAPDPKAPIDVAALDGGARSRPGIRVHRYANLDESQIRMRNGVPMTTVERALLDGADEISGRDLERALDEAVANRLTSRTKVREIAAANPGRTGAAALLRLAEERRPGARTIREAAELALTLIREARLPEPEAEVTLVDNFTADFFFRDSGVVLEIDSFSFHGVIRENFNRDRRKDRAFRKHGLEVVRVTYDELKATPLLFIADLSTAIAARAAARAA